MSLLPISSSLYSPPAYTKPNNNENEITQVSAATSNMNTEEGNNTSRSNNNNNNKPHRHRRYCPHHHRNHQQRNKCHICGNRNTPTNVRDIGPYLIHRTKPDLVLVCPCLNRAAHPICLKTYGTDYICNVCNYIYQSRRYINFFAQFLCFVCHLLSLASTVGLVFGLSQLGRALDEIGLGNEIGPKLDGDETWQDHEMTQIVQWLNIVHFATGFAGEALLGLVYIVGVCLVIGIDRTLVMVSNILYIQLDWTTKNNKKRRTTPKWITRTFICIFLFVLGLVLGTYLLFFSWIWASVLHHVRKRVLDVKVNKFYNENSDSKISQGLPPPLISMPAASV
jgi:hypothetical protein